MADNKILITKEKFEECKKELKRLIDVERPIAIKAIQAAREQGDLSENADYDAAKNRQAEIEAKIKELENIVNFAEIIDEKSFSKKEKTNNLVKIGTCVRLLDLSKDKDKLGKLVNISKPVIGDGCECEIAIVGEIEANPDEGKISNVSPLAVAILGHEEGEIVEIKGIEKPYKVKILKISRL